MIDQHDGMAGGGHGGEGSGWKIWMSLSVKQFVGEAA